MLAKLVQEPFHKPGWVYEEKYDGIRVLAYKEGPRVSLLSRNGIDRTHNYPAVVSSIAALAPDTLLLDGEIVSFDRKHISRFQLLQEGGAEHSYAVFDCLYELGRDLRRQPLVQRRAALESIVGNAPALLISRRLAENGLAAFKLAAKRGYEGIVAKELASPYVEGRSAKWLKVKVHQEEEFVIGGYTNPAGSRNYFGALLLGAYEGEKLHFVGKVGTGFDEKALASLHDRFRPLVQQKSPFVDPRRESAVTYLKPKLVAQVSFQEWTSDRKLRQPVYLGLRDDKRPIEVRLPPKASL